MERGRKTLSRGLGALMEMNWAHKEKLANSRVLIKGHMVQDGPGKQGRELS